jgi:ADP-ribose pyrophosphatase
MSKWQTKKHKVVYKDSWVSLIVDSIADDKNAKTDYVYIARTTVGTAVVPYFEKEKSVLLVRQYRHPLKKEIWQFPGGGKEKGKTFKKTVEVELLEETGHEATSLIDLGRYYPDAGISSDEGRIFLALNPKRVNKLESDPLEKIRFKRFTLSQMEKMIKNGRIRDGWTLGAYALFNLWMRQK